MKTTVVYHSGDYDGIFCREIARKFLPNAELIGWNFGDPLIEYPTEGTLYVLDLSPECLNQVPSNAACKIVWIDHHKTSIDKWPKDISGYRIDGVAACRLAWQWFAGNHHGVGEKYGLPSKEEFIARQTYIRGVREPWAVRLAGEYDIWDKRDPDAETFQYGLRCTDDRRYLAFLEDTEDSKHGHSDRFVQEVLGVGSIAQRYAKMIDADLVTHRSYMTQWEGLNWLVLNTGRFNSLTFEALDKPETGHDALMGYMFNGSHWIVSLYHAKHRTELDLSKIAVKYKGGGHRGACGFTCDKLPFQ